jgi:Caspase domain
MPGKVNSSVLAQVIFALALFLVTTLAWQSTAVAASVPIKRLALVIGNSKYTSVSALENPQRDATSISESLLALQFEVYRGTDLTRDELKALLAEFKSKIKSVEAEAVVFYYAGHGFQFAGANHLVPTDATLQDPETLLDETIELNAIINEISGPLHQTIILLDACRDNPLPSGEVASEISQGLAEVQTGSGTFIAFATEPNKVAKDGFGKNSPFTQALLANIDTPLLSISEMMINVRNEVNKLTANQQTPTDFSKLRAQFQFNPTNQRPIAVTGGTWQKHNITESGSGAGRTVVGIIESALPEQNVNWQVASLSNAATVNVDNTQNLVTGTLAVSPNTAITAISLQQQLAFLVQKDLKRLRCVAFEADGEWGKGTVKGLQRVKKETGISFREDAPDEFTLAALNSLTGPLCKPECRKGERLGKDGKCKNLIVQAKDERPTKSDAHSSKSPGKTDNKKATKASIESTVGAGSSIAGFD